MVKKLTLIWIAIIAFYQIGSSQNVGGGTQNPNVSIEAARMRWQAKQVIPPSPEAAELGKYGNVPVSLYTGTPNITIPFFELKGNTISLPISLSYNASGFKPSEAASWVGSGWSLNAGGVITRAVKGNPDDETNYFGVPNLLNPPSETDIIPYHNYIKDIHEMRKETQPDIYYYNFNGHSGKFILRPDKTVAKAKKDLKKIDLDNTGGFTVIDEKGIKYVFEEIEETTMYPQDIEGRPNYYSKFTSSWFLTRIYSPDGVEVIEFEYHSPTIPQSGIENLQQNKSVSYTYGVKYNQNWSCNFGSKIDRNSYLINQPPFTSVIRKFLKRISYKKNSLLILYVDIISDKGLRLDSDYTEDRHVKHLKLYARDNSVDKLIKQFDFQYGYFTNNNNVFNKKRLRLDYIQEVGNDLVSKLPTYSFTYNESFLLPERNTLSLDHWGFYNEAFNTSLIPYYYFQAQVINSFYNTSYFFSAANLGDGANREASFNGSSATMLTKIQYPTGGFTVFDYELNQANVNGIIKDIGGVRIKKITDYSSINNQILVKNYAYQLADGSTSGQIGAWPEYHTKSTFFHLGGLPNFSSSDCEGLDEVYNYELHTISISANAVFGLGSFQGSHIGYAQVTESLVELNTNQSLGKTVYKYLIGNYHEHNEDIRSGNLIEKTVFNTQNTKLEQTTLSYNWTLDFDIVAKIPKANDYQTDQNYYCKTSSGSYENYTEWQTKPSYCIELQKIPTKTHLETQTFFIQDLQTVEETHKTYNPQSGDSITTTKNMTYHNNTNQIKSISTIASNSNQIKTEFTYPFNYPGTPIYDAMVAKNMISPVIESKTTTNGVQVAGQKINYAYFNNNTLIAESSASKYNTVTQNYEPVMSINQYSTKGNMLEQQKTNDIKTSYLWAYNEAYPIAQAVNADYGSISYSSFEATETGNWDYTSAGINTTEGITGKQSFNLSNSNIQRTGLLSSKNYTITYWLKNGSGTCSLGGTALINKNGWTLYETTVTGITTLTISGSALIDELRLYPRGAQMTTYTYLPLVGISSQCDANSKIMYYEYDAFNRLKLIKDQDGNILKTFGYQYKEPQ